MKSFNARSCSSLDDPSSPRSSRRSSAKSRTSAAALRKRKPSTSELLLPLELLQRLQQIALRRAASQADAADAVQQLLIDVWLRGAYWHEGRIVLHLKSLLRNERRAQARRVRREAIYVMMAGEDSR